MKIVTPVVATLLQLSDFLPAGKADLLCNTSRIQGSNYCQVKFV